MATFPFLSGGQHTCRRLSCMNFLPVPVSFQLFIFGQGPSLHSGNAWNKRKLSCTTAALLSKEDKSVILKGVQKDHYDIASRSIDQALAASSKWGVAHTDFLTPPAQQDVMMVLSRLSQVKCSLSGGYSQAERCRVSMGHPEAMDAAVSADLNGRGHPEAVSALQVRGRFDFEPSSHGDFLGSILGCGITREKVGDVIVQDGQGAQILLVPELVEFVRSSMTSVRRVRVTVEPIELSAIETREAKVDTVKTVEASLRVDAVASAGFRMSRTKLAELIGSGLIRVNWREMTKGGLVLKPGDVISVRGKGRLEVQSVSTTKKGKYVVEMTRYT